MSCFIFALIEVPSSFAASASGIGSTNNPKISSNGDGLRALSVSVSAVSMATSRFSNS
ncbi:hypothetical protein NZOSNM25_002043 [Nitrosopumilus zosterae]|nr:hypothetical protein [Nitrosopumilus zosterae]BDQ31901.1 hypothetical protein NZOSNM25_002043 [Nitrosopumilus zosterae]